MASIASQVILHPVISQSLKVWATTLGRDKTYRAIQYFARFFAWHLIRRGYNVEGARWNSLKVTLASGRKMMRLFKPLEHLQAALHATQIAATPPEQITTIGRQICYAGYLTYDMLVWAHAIRFIDFSAESAAKLNKTSLRFWLSGIVFSIAHGVLKAGRLTNEANSLRQPINEKSSFSDDAAKRARLGAISTQLAATQYQLVIDTFDVWLPATGLGIVSINDGFAGILGFITSVMALRSQWIAVNSK